MNALPLLPILVYSFTLWMGLYVLVRNPGKPGMRFAGMGLTLYAMVLLLITTPGDSTMVAIDESGGSGGVLGGGSPQHDSDSSATAIAPAACTHPDDCQYFLRAGCCSAGDTAGVVFAGYGHAGDWR